MLRAQIRALAMTTLACATFMACGDGKKSNSGINTQTLLTQLSEALQTCGVLGAGRLQNQVSELPETDAAQQQCLAGCVSAADCAALSDAFCNNGGSLLACVGACLQPKCGDGTVLSAGQLCDGTSDCADGSDEQGCAATLFECGEGDGTVSIQQRCDGSNDCEGGADEEGCPTFDCGDDSMVPGAAMRRATGLPERRRRGGLPRVYVRRFGGRDRPRRGVRRRTGLPGERGRGRLRAVHLPRPRPMMRGPRCGRSSMRIGIFVSALATLGACGEGSKSNAGLGGGELYTQLAQQLQTCELLGPGRVENQISRIPSTDMARVACVAACMASQTCAQLTQAYCEEDGPLLGCLGDCLGHRCGDGTVLNALVECNGFPDCADGSDEVGCEGKTFTCGDGDTIRADGRCNGFPECEDRSDEADCPEFNCAGTDQIIEQRLVCNGFPECTDGSDEVECDYFECGTLNVFPPQMCNGYPDCLDGSDETGCAQFQCP
ncbi:MAG: LDL receptor domain-containing protein [Myxococcota bacterium]